MTLKTISSMNWRISIRGTTLTSLWALLKAIISKTLWKSPRILMLRMLCHNFLQKLSFQELAQAPPGLELTPATTVRASTNTSPKSKTWTKNAAWLASSTPKWTSACNQPSVTKLRRNPECEKRYKAKTNNSASLSSKALCTNKINHRQSIIKTFSALQVVQAQKLSTWTIPPAIQGEKLMITKPSRAT